MRLTTFIAVFALFAFTAPGCSSDDQARPDADPTEGRPHMTTEETDDGMIAEYVDSNGDGNADIVRYYEEYEDPRDADRMVRQLRKMEIDATDDGTYNVERHYDEYGNLDSEKVDKDLDGTFDAILEFSGGELSRKKILDDDGDDVQERRIYYEGQLVRVERDENGDGEIDRWEYYEDQVLMRIGHDTTGDGSVDTWQMR